MWFSWLVQFIQTLDSWSVGLTQRSLAGSGPGVGDLLTRGVHTPTLSDAGVTLRRLEGSMLITLCHVLIDGRSRTEEGEEGGGGGGGGGGLSAFSLMLALRLLSLWTNTITFRVRHHRNNVNNVKIFDTRLSFHHVEFKLEEDSNSLTNRLAVCA